MLGSPQSAGVVLIVDDVPENLAMLHDALIGADYTVLIATGGELALERAGRLPPDLILLDALMPGIDGFETCRAFKSAAETQHIPVIFMTGLQETQHILRGFEVGGVDYVTKPIKPHEVLARIASHLKRARDMEQIQLALDAVGRAVITVNEDRVVSWQTPAAQTWLSPHIESDGCLLDAFQACLTLSEAQSLKVRTAKTNLIFRRLVGDARGITLLVSLQSTVPDPAVLQANFALTGREADVLYWIAYGKTNRDIADIIGMSPRTVDKHLEHIFAKLGVETRTAAASIALGR
ncbi:response regulator transcription factor [Pararobbsia silviterrae]|uniref:DNA-binding response regulator n=1 Tax=Pararobbsia silviterrae TaxID=1792498 RepID=A0A494XAZ2_9BURK|nr:response regulator transcription factor [Pararobbsia silviterrae]RKP47690.1 DNA-binding response regulator [Pararobbsia silviterrae]